MAKVKRAKWIEGITQSKRILNDIAEIATTAIQDENGVIKAENWELIYPRPFHEEKLSRARLIQKQEKQFTDRNENITLSSTTPTVALVGVSGETIDDTTIIVKSTDGVTTYTAGTDYSYNADTNEVTWISTGSIASGSTVTVHYKTWKLVDTRNYYPIVDHSEYFILNGTTAVQLSKTRVDETTLVVTSTDGVTTYVKGTDYVYDAVANTIARTASSAIPDNSEVLVNYGTKLYQILDSVPVKVEKSLVVANPDRELDPSTYTIDRPSKSIKFLSDPPADAAYFALTFTEINGPYDRQEEVKLKLEQDPLDPMGYTFRLPVGSGDIGVYPVDNRRVAGATSGHTGTGSGGSIQYTLDEINHKVTFSAGEPVLGTNMRAFINVWEYTDPPVNSTDAPRRFEITPNLDSMAPAGEWLIIGAANELNEGREHSVDIETDTTKPVLYKHLSSLHAGYEELPRDEYTVDYTNPGVTTIQYVTEDLVVSLTAREAEDLQVGFSKIKDRVVLKTKTEPEQVFTSSSTDQYGATDTASNLEMYVELFKPNRLINPETGLERYMDHKGMQHQTQYNNHYIQTRMFDRWDDNRQKPMEATYDAQGDLIDKGAYVSEWSKYAWFQDWKEYMVDELDDDPGSANVTDGIIFKEVNVTGMTDEFPIQFWISTNNNRIAMVLMGDPTLDQDNFLTSFGYFGRIHPFFDKECVVKKDANGNIVLDANGDPVIEEKRTYFQNDVSGNFALTTGSSTVPVSIGAPPQGSPIVDTVEIATDDTGAKVYGDLYDKTAYAYVVTYLTEVGESKPTPVGDGQKAVPLGEVDPLATVPTVGISLKIRFRLPDIATGYRIYRYHDADTNTFAAQVNDYSNYKLVTSVTKLDRQRTIEYLDQGVSLPMQEGTYDSATGSTTYSLIPTSWDAFYSKFLTAVPSARSFESVIRDKFTGAILEVKFSDKYGRDTGTGVSDIMMFQTRSGLKFQRHNGAFITTEEFMKKEKSGQSRWTGKFHLSPVYLEHSYDKQRGWLDGVMAVDDSGIEHLDELIVDKDTPTEEVYKFFRVNAPYSFFNNSPNYAYGLAIIKSSLRWS